MEVLKCAQHHCLTALWTVYVISSSINISLCTHTYVWSLARNRIRKWFMFCISQLPCRSRVPFQMRSSMIPNVTQFESMTECAGLCSCWISAVIPELCDRWVWRSVTCILIVEVFNPLHKVWCYSYECITQWYCTLSINAIR